jgi:hypothetical protein
LPVIHNHIPPIIIVTMATIIAVVIVAIIIMMILLIFFLFLLMAAPPCSPVLLGVDGPSLLVDTAGCCWSAYPGWWAR